jgi:hypothetical protein
MHQARPACHGQKLRSAEDNTAPEHKKTGRQLLVRLLGALSPEPCPLFHHIAASNPLRTGSSRSALRVKLAVALMSCDELPARTS